MNKVALTIAAGLTLVGSQAFAGFTAVTGPTTILTPGVPGQAPTVGEAFNTQTSGGFTSFVGDTAADPTITGNDLSKYRFTLTGASNSVNLATGVIDYTGAYNIFYDLQGNQLFVPGVDPTVSTGTFNIVATFITGTNNANLTGALTQTAGPTNPAFRDLSEGGSPVLINGTFNGNNPDVSGVLTATLRQNATVPEPASVGLLSVAGVALSARRRRVAK